MTGRREPSTARDATERRERARRARDGMARLFTPAATPDHRAVARAARRARAVRDLMQPGHGR